ncbi:hypothetical protein [Sulfurovum sp.]|jgi:hypothetical protein|uniref:hypothetical protein n=1 Tax=Sulfurovum sp. TaxID=1969726 RepID=UPI002A361C9D|nr:hypothetical protein [Sulfurovum sp.]MDY0401820.1 hypothetical protein [Sulfurovum sp.]
MVKKLFMLLVLSIVVFADNAYERHCVPCHRELPTDLQGMFKNYLLVYSGEETVKAALRHYMRYPSKHISVMSDLFIDTYGIKQKLNISDQELKEAIDLYWEKYKVFGKLN